MSVLTELQNSIAYHIKQLDGEIVTLKKKSVNINKWGFYISHMKIEHDFIYT